MQEKGFIGVEPKVVHCGVDVGNRFGVVVSFVCVVGVRHCIAVHTSKYGEPAAQFIAAEATQLTLVGFEESLAAAATFAGCFYTLFKFFNF